MSEVRRLLVVLCVLLGAIFPRPAHAAGGSFSDQGAAYSACLADAKAWVQISTSLRRSPSCYLNSPTVYLPRAECRTTVNTSTWTTCNPGTGSYSFPAGQTCASKPEQPTWAPPAGTTSNVCSGGCSYTYTVDATNIKGYTFMPSGSTCDVADTPEPKVDTDGDGVPDEQDAFPTDPNESKDSDGDGIGDNADIAPDDPTNGKDDGEGDEKDNSASGGGTCGAPPSCSGDAIACNTNWQIWKLRCSSAQVTGSPEVCNAAYSCSGDSAQCAQIALLRKTACSNAISGNIDSDGDGFGIGDKNNLQAIKDAVTGDGEGVGDVPVPWIDGVGDGEEWNSGLGGGSCPSPISRTVSIAGHSQAIEFFVPAAVRFRGLPLCGGDRPRQCRFRLHHFGGTQIMPWLAALLTSLLGSAVARLLTGAGLGLVTFAALTPVVLSALNLMRDKVGGITGAVADIMLLSGMGLALTMIGSAIMTRVAIDAGKVAVAKAASK